jgi:hypothetical protein
MKQIKRCGVRFLVGLAIGALAAGVTTTFVSAQETTGAIIGTVKDSTGGALPGVTVVVRSEKTGETRTVVTDASGFYQVRVLPTGTYRLSFTLDGFKTIAQEGVPVEAAVSRALNLTLEVGGLEETVTVTAAPEAVQLDTATVSYQVSAMEIEQIPSATRNYTHLLTSTAGVSADLPPVAVNDTGSISPSVNGTRTTSSSLFYDGVDITSLLSNRGTMDENIVPAPETIEEVKLQTSLYDASTGRSGGGNFQIVTKSGGNGFNGTAYTFQQHEKLMNNDFFNERFGLEKPKGRRSESGLSLGGPLRQDRAFFYGAYQRTDANTGFVPTARSRALIPAALGLISGERTAENIVAAFRSLNPSFNLTPGQISPTALAILNLVNPATGDYLIPGAAGPVVANDRVVSIGGLGNLGGDPLVELRNIIPAEFQQDQLSAKLDFQLSDANRLSGSFFFSNFPSLDPFPDPSSLASPVTLRRSNQGRVLAISDTHVWSKVINEIRFGYLSLGNTRRLDDDFLGITNAQVGVVNPALAFDDRDATRRLGHYVNRSSNLSWGGPNDVFNQREQDTFHLLNAVSWNRGNHSFRLGGELKQHFIATNLPEEQATEFEKIENFQQFLLGFTSEADTQFGFTEKNFRSRDLGFFFLDDYRVNGQLTLNLGLRWDWFSWPYEKGGFFGNFLEREVTDPDNPLSGFRVPSNIGSTGFNAIDGAIDATVRSDSKSTLDGEDLNNFQPRVGFAWTPRQTSDRFVIRGGYGIFYDRLTAAFMNTVFSNYPLLREIEITRPTRAVPIANAFATQNTNLPFNQWLPMRVFFEAGNYVIRDNTGVAEPGALNPGNTAETFEFRAVDPELVNPYYHQWNIGYQWGFSKDLVWEVRYNGALGKRLLESVSFNQPYDLNDPEAPQYVKDRITAAYRAGGGTANAQDPKALGYGYLNPSTGRADNNFGPGSRLISTEARTPYLGFNDAEAVLLRNADWNSIYHGFQTTVSKRFSRGFQFHAAYTYSQSRDNFSSDPGSTAGGGRPDVPNTGFVVENDSRNVGANRAPSDFDRPHRLAASFVYLSPRTAPAFLRNWQISSYLQFQSGRPFSLFEPEPSGRISRSAFLRPDYAAGANADTLAQQGADPVERYFNTSAIVACVSPCVFGNVPRNVLRGPDQKRVDLAISRQLFVSEARYLELRVDVFNLFNWTNFDIPVNEVGSEDFGKILNTLGGPRTGQLGLKFVF